MMYVEAFIRFMVIYFFNFVNLDVCNLPMLQRYLRVSFSMPQKEYSSTWYDSHAYEKTTTVSVTQGGEV